MCRKKIRVRHLIGKATDHFSLKEFSHESSQGNSSESFTIENDPSIPFQEILGNFDSFALDIDESAKLYICGYAAHSVCKKIKCDLCMSFIRKSKGTYTEDEYFNFLQRGGLSVPQEILQFLFVHMCSIFENIVNHSKYSAMFLTSENQKVILINLTSLSVQNDFWFDDFNHFCDCGQNMTAIFNMLCSIFSNILLNNYVKNVNSAKLESSKRKKEGEKVDNKNKIRKLKSLQK